jgi:uncharacterized protein (TIGR02145 family)
MKSIFLISFFAMVLLGFESFATSIIQGQITYANSVSTPLSGTTVYLEDIEGNVVQTTLANSAGFYYFTVNTPGSYLVRATTTIAPGGINATDALLVLKHFTGESSLSGIYVSVADLNNSGYINTLDALIIQKRFNLLIQSFATGDWFFNQTVLEVTDGGTYFVNIQGLCYGDVNGSFVPASTPGNFCPGIPAFVYGGQLYNTVQIGTQCWMKENLNIGTMVNGTSSQTNNGIIEKYCYSNSAANCQIYGGLYQWSEMMQYVTTAGTQGICPSGWHLPASSEFTILDNFLGGASVAGGKIKETGTVHWKDPNTGATNSSGFTGLGSGRRYNSQSFGGLKDYLDLWSSSSYNSANAYNLYIYSYETSTHQGYAPKIDGFGVRCVKD